MATRTYGSQNQGLLVMRNVDFTNPANGKGTDQMTIPGQILIATGAAFPAAQIVANTLTAGPGIAIANGPGTITISATLTGGTDVDAFTAPGTDPVVPNGGGIITVTGAQIAANSTPNVIRTNSLVANAYRIEIQRSSAIAASTIARNGVCHFNSAQFTVDANGFVSLAGGSLAVDSIGVQASTAPGTNPVLPTAGGLITIQGAVVAAAATPVRSNSILANQLRIEVQVASQQAISSISNAGLASFNSAQFSVDASGFVSIVPGAGSINITPDAGLNVTNSAFSLTAVAVAPGVVPIRTNGTALNALQIELQRSASSVATNATQQGIASFNSAHFSVDGSGWVSSLNGLPISSVDVDGATAPGTDPVLPTALGVMGVGGAQVAAGTVPSAIRTQSIAANSYQIQVQRSSAQAISSVTQNGVCHFDSADFTVDANGFVSAITSVFTWQDFAGGALAVSNGYFATAAAVYTLPAGTTDGETVEIIDNIGGGVVVTAQGGNTIRIQNTASSANGTATSSQFGDALRLIYRASISEWQCCPGGGGMWTLA